MTLLANLLDRPVHVLAIAAVLAVVGVGRVTRLVTHDGWPPIAKLRERWVVHHEVKDTGWADLFRCPYCFAPWAALVSLGWALASGLDGWWGAAWWLGHGWFTLAYLAAILVAYDEPAEVD